MGQKSTRRHFVRSVLASAAIAALSRHGGLPALAAGRTDERLRPLGRTGVRVFPLGLGGEAVLEDPARSDRAISIVDAALDLGVTYIDTAPLYGEGASERAIGEIMQTRRAEAFLASKTHDRSYDGSMRLLDASLRRLRTDHLDLWQLHNIQTDTDVDFILTREGAARALRAAQEQGIVRFTGITGHRDPAVLARAMREFPFDTVLMALNAADKHHNSFITGALPTAVDQGLGIVGMKVTSRGKLFRKPGIRTMEEALRYVLSLPVSTAIVGISTIEELRENVRLVESFLPCTSAEMQELESRTREYFAEALWYRDHL